MNRKPNFFIVGAPKSGTTSMAAYLAEHPNVFFATPKEPFFWDSDLRKVASRIRLNSTEDYLRLFSPANPHESVLGEGSTSYLLSDVAIPRIVEFAPDAKFVAMLRNPVEMVHALHMEFLFSFNENIADFESAWRAQSTRAKGNRIPNHCPPEFLQYANWGRYAVQIERFFKAVPKEQRLVLLFDDFKADCGSCYRQTLDLLGLPDDCRTEFPVLNSSHEHRSKLVAKLVLSPPPMVEPIVMKVRQFLREHRLRPIERLKALLKKKNKRIPMRPEFKAELVDFFKDDVSRLSDLLGRDLSSWADV